MRRVAIITCDCKPECSAQRAAENPESIAES
jgi:hypothetical protein